MSDTVREHTDRSGDTGESPGRIVPSTRDATAVADKRPVSWRNRALDRYAELKLLLDKIQVSRSDDVDRCMDIDIGTAYDWLDFAFGVASNQPTRGKRPKAMWRGSDIDNTWMALHRAHALIVQLTPDGSQTNELLVDARQRAKQLLKPTDERLTALDKASRPLPAKGGKVADGTMRLAAGALAAAYDANAEQHRQVRDFRNILIVTTIVTMVAAVALAWVGFVWPNALSVCWPATGPGTICPSGPGGPTVGDVALVEFLGLIAAAVTGALAIRRLRGTSTPYSVPMWSVLVKLPIGALTAYLGLMFLHVMPGLTVTTRFELIAWALVFGVSQEAFTRLLDRRAQSVLNSIATSSKDGATDSNEDAAREASV